MQDCFFHPRSCSFIINFIQANLLSQLKQPLYQMARSFSPSQPSMSPTKIPITSRPSCHFSAAKTASLPSQAQSPIELAQQNLVLFVSSLLLTYFTDFYPHLKASIDSFSPPRSENLIPRTDETLPVLPQKHTAVSVPFLNLAFYILYKFISSK